MRRISLNLFKGTWGCFHEQCSEDREICAIERYREWIWDVHGFAKTCPDSVSELCRIASINRGCRLIKIKTSVNGGIESSVIE